VRGLFGTASRREERVDGVIGGESWEWQVGGSWQGGISVGARWYEFGWRRGLGAFLGIVGGLEWDRW